MLMAPVLRMEPSALRDKVNVGALHAALEAPARQWQGNLIHGDLAEQGAALVEAFLRRPPHPTADIARPLAFLTLIAFLEHNGAILQVTEEQRAAFLRQRARATASRADLTHWISQRLVLGKRPLSPPTGGAITPAPRVMFAVPVCQHVASTGDPPWQDVAGWIDATLCQYHDEGERWTITVEAPALEHHVVDADLRADSVDVESEDEATRLLAGALGREPNGRFRRRLIALLRGVSALVIYGEGGGSFGTGNEFGRIPRSTPVLYLRPHGAPLSRWLDDLVQYAHVEVVDLPEDPDFDAMQEIVSSWLQAWRHAIEQRARARQVRMLRSGPMAALFAERWGRLERKERLEAFIHTALPSDVFFSLLTPEGVADARKEELEAICDALGLDFSAAASSAPLPTLTRRQRRALSEFADEYRIERPRERDLEEQAEDALALGTLRYALNTRGDWARFLTDVYRARLG